MFFCHWRSTVKKLRITYLVTYLFMPNLVLFFGKTKMR